MRFWGRKKCNKAEDGVHFTFLLKESWGQREFVFCGTCLLGPFHGNNCSGVVRSLLVTYISTKSWRGYIFTSVCLSVCVYVCMCVCVWVCVCPFLNKMPIEPLHRFWHGFRKMVANKDGCHNHATVVLTFMKFNNNHVKSLIKPDLLNLKSFGIKIV